MAQEPVFPIDPTTNEISFNEVVESPYSKDILYNKALEWFAVHFKSGKDVVQIKDKEQGKILGKYVVVNVTNLGNTSVTVQILIKDNKYKYVFSDVYYTGGGGSSSFSVNENPSIWKVGVTKLGIKSIKQLAYASVTSSIASLKAYMNQKDVADF